MRFMMLVRADPDYEAGRPPSPELMDAVGRLSAEMAQKGLLVGQGGLLPSSQGAKVRISGGKLKVLDGPFSEARELIGGYAIFELKSREEAIELAKQFMRLHSDVLGASYDGEVEVRAMFGGEGC
jgi:hypothetical protein